MMDDVDSWSRSLDFFFFQNYIEALSMYLDSVFLVTYFKIFFTNSYSDTLKHA